MSEKRGGGRKRQRAVEEDPWDQLGRLVLAATKPPGHKKRTSSTGSWQSLPPDALKDLKQLCRTGAAIAAGACDLLMRRLEKDDSQVRYMALLLLAELFQRSRAARAAVATQHLRLLVELTVGHSLRKPLPPPADAADALKEKALSLLCAWNDAFGQEYRQLSIAYRYLHETRGLGFANLLSRRERDAQEEVRRERRTRRLVRAKADQFLRDAPAQIAELESLLQQLDECLHVAVPSAADMLTSVGAAGRSYSGGSSNGGGASSGSGLGYGWGGGSSGGGGRSGAGGSRTGYGWGGGGGGTGSGKGNGLLRGVLRRQTEGNGVDGGGGRSAVGTQPDERGSNSAARESSPSPSGTGGEAAAAYAGGARSDAAGGGAAMSGEGEEEEEWEAGDEEKAAAAAGGFADGSSGAGANGDGGADDGGGSGGEEGGYDDGSGGGGGNGYGCDESDADEDEGPSLDNIVATAGLGSLRYELDIEVPLVPEGLRPGGDASAVADAMRDLCRQLVRTFRPRLNEWIDVLARAEFGEEGAEEVGASGGVSGAVSGGRSGDSRSRSGGGIAAAGGATGAAGGGGINGGGGGGGSGGWQSGQERAATALLQRALELRRRLNDAVSKCAELDIVP